jgi:hypothetical protein
MNFKRLFSLALLALLPLLISAQAACPDDAAIQSYLTDFAKR